MVWKVGEGGRACCWWNVCRFADVLVLFCACFSVSLCSPTWAWGGDGDGVHGVHGVRVRLWGDGIMCGWRWYGGCGRRQGVSRWACVGRWFVGAGARHHAAPVHASRHCSPSKPSSPPPLHTLHTTHPFLPTASPTARCAAPPPPLSALAFASAALHCCRSTH